MSLKVGGTITGEHGVGVEKINSMCVQFSPAERDLSSRSSAPSTPRTAQSRQGDPHLHRCAEYGKMHVHRGMMPFPELPNFDVRVAGRRYERIDRRALRAPPRSVANLAAAPRLSTAKRRAASRLPCASPGITSYEPSELVVTARAGRRSPNSRARSPRKVSACRSSRRASLRGVPSAAWWPPAFRTSRAAFGALRDYVLGLSCSTGAVSC